MSQTSSKILENGTKIRLIKDARGEPPFKIGTMGVISGHKSFPTTPEKPGQQPQGVSADNVTYKFKADWETQEWSPSPLPILESKIPHKLLSPTKKGLPLSEPYENAALVFLLEDFTYSKQGQKCTVEAGTALQTLGPPVTNKGSKVRKALEGYYQTRRMDWVVSVKQVTCGTYLDHSFFEVVDE
ncbi:hypothetical protein HYDPIDRAFT_113547 [Hydnomerulius pinastri MD-312]|uniref:Uncharacterized protein n=1 Tax=Hydnomerulius pinastri MD-312 TaxID=994086 RepID=A0A0C9VXP4_9AGAM|nr:hypothetical protein HYDPIDRAFT_113547 [Hydnomerulius pinastri MD-312]